MILAKLGLVAVLLTLPLLNLAADKPAASRVTFRGSETLSEAVAALKKSGNDITDPPPSNTPLKLTAGDQDFWPALDDLCRQTRLQARLRNDRIELTQAEGKGIPRFAAYDGPFRGVITRRTVTAYDDAGMGLDRLTLQMELACEPRMQPLLLQLPGNGLSWQWGDVNQSSSARAGLSSYPFEGEKTRAFEVRLPRPERTVKQIDHLAVKGLVWVSADRLDLDMPLKADAEVTRGQTTFRIEQISNPDPRTRQVVTTLTYPPGSMEWESHQAGLLGAIKMTLTSGDTTVTNVGQEVRTDESRRLEIRWLFSNLPARADAWRAKIVVPSAPVSYPLKLEFKNVELP